jgi:aconitate hydratase
VEKHPERYFERVVEIDLSKLEPQIVGPHTPDLVRPVSRLREEVREKGYPDALTAALIGSCTNSSYEDITRAADVAEQARARGVKVAVPFMVTPGSEQIHATIERDGQLATLTAIGGNVLANACGPCIGQWRRDDYKKGSRNAIITSFNRNFPGRNDGNPETLAFMGSPEVVVAYALSGRLTFNPLADELEAPDGTRFKLRAPGKAPDLPDRGFVRARSGYVEPATDPERVEVVIREGSERLARFEPFPAWDGKDFVRLPVLLKTRGKCTTDHISPAGPWLRYRGHLDRISDNLFLGAVNAFTGKAGEARSILSGATEPVPKVARAYKAAGLRWVVVGDENYGEGSSREHAAMSARFLGAAAIIVRSFARIHESNLKKQGVLPLTFANPSDYDKVEESDRVSLVGLSGLAPGKPVTAVLHHAGGREERIELRHTLNEEQIAWFRAGSALNLLRQQGA